MTLKVFFLFYLFFNFYVRPKKKKTKSIQKRGKKQPNKKLDNNDAIIYF